MTTPEDIQLTEQDLKDIELDFLAMKTLERLQSKKETAMNAAAWAIREYAGESFFYAGTRRPGLTKIISVLDRAGGMR